MRGARSPTCSSRAAGCRSWPAAPACIPRLIEGLARCPRPTKRCAPRLPRTPACAAERRCTELAAVDPETGARIRATADNASARAGMFRLTGRPIGAWQRTPAVRGCRSGAQTGAGTGGPRAALHDRIAQRFRYAMLEAGFLDEVRALRAFAGTRRASAPTGPAGHARGGLPAGMGVPRTASTPRNSMTCHRRHPPAGQTPVNMVARRTRCAGSTPRPSARGTRRRRWSAFLPRRQPTPVLSHRPVVPNAGGRRAWGHVGASGHDDKVTTRFE